MADLSQTGAWQTFQDHDSKIVIMFALAHDNANNHTFGAWHNSFQSVTMDHSLRVLLCLNVTCVYHVASLPGGDAGLFLYSFIPRLVLLVADWMVMIGCRNIPPFPSVSPVKPINLLF